MTRDDVILLAQCINSMTKLILESWNGCSVIQLIKDTSYSSLLYLGREHQDQTVCLQNTTEVHLVIGAEEKSVPPLRIWQWKSCFVCRDALLPTLFETIMFCVQRRKNYAWTIILCVHRQLHAEHCFSVTGIDINSLMLLVVIW